MGKKGLIFFETAIGLCGLAWTSRGVVGVQLPESTDLHTKEKLQGRYPNLSISLNPNKFVLEASRSIVLHVEGRAQDFSDAKINMASASSFSNKVYDMTRRIPVGKTISYGSLAKKIGMPNAARAVGRALGANPVPLLVPCHRVVASNGALTGFSAAGGVDLKRRLLEIERMSLEHTRGFLYSPARAATYLKNQDENLGCFIDKIGMPKLVLRETSTLFVALTRTIIGQQLSVKAAATIFKRFCDLLPRGLRGLNPKNYLALTEPRLRSAGLSRNKISAIKDLAERSLSRNIPSLSALKCMQDTQVVQVLSSVRGIGKWTAEMVLLFRLGRPDVLAVDDLGLRLGHAILVNKGRETDRKALTSYGEQWRPYRSVASWYLWRILDLSR